MLTDFRRVAIVNRGEPAMRFIHAVREYNLEHRTDIRVIALFTEPDRHARYVREADESVDLGPSSFVDDADGLRRPAYLDYRVLERALTESQADAAWTGWGFVAERPEFAELCERLGVTIIGPDSGSMRRLGDKICAKRLAEQAGIPVIPWGDGPDELVIREPYKEDIYVSEDSSFEAWFASGGPNFGFVDMNLAFVDSVFLTFPPPADSIRNIFYF